MNKGKKYLLKKILCIIYLQAKKPITKRINPPKCHKIE